MGKNNKKGKTKLSKKLREDILSLFAENPNKQLNYKQVASFLEVHDGEIRKLIYTILNTLSQEGLLKEVQRGKFKAMNIPKQSSKLIGVFDAGRRGSGYVIVEGFNEDIFISERNTGRAMNGDTVAVELTRSKGKKLEGKITNVIERKNKLIVGSLDIQDHFSFLVPDDPKLNVDIFISGSALKGAQNGDKAIAEITDWPDTAKSPFGKIVEVLGRPESNEAEMKGILAANGIKFTFPDEVLAEASQISMQLPEEEIANRRDFRDILTITIDPIDAKDFDDALSIEFLDKEMIRVGVHIADVGHYVKEGSQLDIEALERGNSVYLVDRVIPMLPEHLSNGVCSLRPDEDKFAFSAVFDLDMNGDVHSQWFGKTVIRSKRRFAYEEAQEIIESGKGELSKEILTLDTIAKNLRDRRMKKGGLEVNTSEIRFQLDEAGKPVEIFKKVQKDANKLIEEFMLLANKSVGKFVGDVKQKHPRELIYRVHDKPDLEKVQQFAVFVSKFGKAFSFKNEDDIAKNMNKLFHEMRDEAEYNVIQSMAIKSMAKAVYDTENIGHYGLGFEYYAHFTSPIRRYADLMVHRVLLNKLNGTKSRIEGMQKTAEHISQTERRAVEAERASKKYFQAVYLEDKEGEIFEGIITGLTDWGIYVELLENFCEGMISLKSLRGDSYYFDENDYVVYGKRSGDEFNLGEHLRVKIAKVSLGRKQIDLELVE
ncbi:ribonuclease R [Paracrocinitomix mangrovi]|uniref:ribonuclease R n=1 Tax=Paracrocinitomix mangrovi TaxID=2862509 RepID=UPI001C8D6E99|nr:ribonuclease R [Paracrocinitomix mangrovi]UKN00535.1 ribonuclease R [Paracrocinitomix mangrovi]